MATGVLKWLRNEFCRTTLRYKALMVADWNLFHNGNQGNNTFNLRLIL
jgi:hypothetical protein